MPIRTSEIVVQLDSTLRAVADGWLFHCRLLDIEHHWMMNRFVSLVNMSDVSEGDSVALHLAATVMDVTEHMQFQIVQSVV